MKSLVCFRAWNLLVVALALLSAVTCSWELRAAEPSGSINVVDGVRSLVYLNVRSFQNDVREDDEFFRDWKRDVQSLLAAGSGVDVAKVESAAWLAYDDGVVAVYKFPAPLNHRETLAWFGSNPWRDRSDVTECYRFTDDETLVLLPGERTVVVSASEAAIERFRAATEQNLDPKRLRDAAGGATTSDLFVAVGEPLPGDLRAMFLHELADSDADVAEKLLEGLSRIELSVSPRSDVPIHLKLRTGSDESARRLARHLADKFFDFVLEYDSGGRAALVADDSVPHTDVLIADLDRMLRGTLVSSQHGVVEVEVKTPGGLPSLFELCIHEYARAATHATHTFENVTEQLQDVEISEGVLSN